MCGIAVHPAAMEYGVQDPLEQNKAKYLTAAILVVVVIVFFILSLTVMH